MEVTRSLRKMNHMIRDIQKLDSVTVCAWPIPVVDVSEPVDALAQNVAKSKENSSLVMVFQIVTNNVTR